MKRIALGLLVLVAAAIALVLATRSLSRPASDAQGPVLVYRVGTVPAASAAVKANEDRAMSLALHDATPEPALESVSVELRIRESTGRPRPSA